MKNSLRNTFLILVLVLPALAAEAQAAPPEHRGGGRGEATPQTHGGAQAAAARAQRQYGGRVLSVRVEEGRGGVYYRVKLLSPDGRVRVVRVPAD